MAVGCQCWQTCPSGNPAQFTMTLSGVGNDTCTDCGMLNATFTLDWVDHVQCMYIHTKTMCGINLGLQVFFETVAGKFTGKVVARAIDPNFPSPKAQWSRSGYPDCKQKTYVLDFESSDLDICTWPATVTIKLVAPLQTDSTTPSADEVKCAKAVTGCEALKTPCPPAPDVGASSDCCFPSDGGCGCEETEDCGCGYAAGPTSFVPRIDDDCNCTLDPSCGNPPPGMDSGAAGGAPGGGGSCTTRGCSTRSLSLYSRNALSEFNERMSVLQQQMQPTLPGIRASGAAANLANGNLVFSLAAPSTGPGDPQLVLTYNSRMPDPADATPLQTYGYGWRSVFDRNVVELAGNIATLMSGSGSSYRYTDKNGSGVYLTPTDVRNSLSESGGVLTETQPDGSKLVYDGSGMLQRTVNSAGKIWTLTLDGSSRIRRVTDPFLRLSTLTYDGSGKLQRYTDSAGRQTNFKVNASGDLVRFVTPELCITTFAYDASHRMRRTVSPDAKLTSFTYHSTGWIRSLMLPLGEITTISSRDWYRTALTDAANQRTTIIHSFTREIEGVITPNGIRTTYLYAGNAPRTFIDGNGQRTSFTYAELANRTSLLQSIRYPTGGVFSVAYDASNKVRRFVDERGSISTLAWASNQRKRLVDAGGGITTYLYNTQNQITGKRDALGIKTSMVYDSVGRRTARIDGLGQRTSYTYDTNSQLRSIRRPLSRIVTYTRDNMGRVTAKVSPCGETTNYVYDVGCRLQTVKRPLADYTTNIYDNVGRLLSVRRPLAINTTFAYDKLGNRRRVLNPINEITTFRYDSASRPIATFNALAERTTIAYDKSSNPIRVVDALNRISTVRYDAVNRPLAMINGAGERTTLAYDLTGNQRRRIDPAGKIWTTIYDKLNKPVAQIDPLGRRTTTIYDKVSQAIGLVNARNARTSMAYDAAGRLRRLRNVTTPVTTMITTYLYDAGGRRTAVINPLGKRTSTVYDAGDHVLAQIDALQKRTTYAYDALCRQRRMVNPLSHVTTTRYDAAGRMVASINPLNQRTSFVLDKASRRLAVWNARGNRTTTTYDDANRRIANIDGTGSRTTFVLDVAGQTRRLLDPNAKITSFVYDAAGRQKVMFDPLAQRTTTIYSQGRLTSRTDGRGTRTTFLYDDAGRVRGRRYPVDVPTTYVFDEVGNRTQLVDASGTTNYKYDSLNRTMRSVNPASKIVTYGYDLASRRVRTVEPAAGIFTYRYDDADQLTVTINPQAQRTTLTYNNVGNVSNRQMSNGTNAAFGFDNAERQTSVVNTRTTGGTIISNLAYTLDAVGNPTQLVRLTRTVATQPSNSVTSTFKYDNADQLLAARNLPWPSSSPTITVTYSYDKAGNRLFERFKQTSVAEVRTSYTYDSANQVTSKRVGAAITSYTYDAAGNQTVRGATNVKWDNEGRLRRTASASKVATFLYNGDNLRVQSDSSSPASTKKFILDGQNVLAETDSGGTNTAVYTLEPSLFGNLVSQRRSATTHWFLFDRLGSTDAATDSGQTISETYRYEPFGGELNQASNVVVNPFLFIGQLGYYDDLRDTGEFLQYLRARYYDTDLGRFVSRDPLGMVGTVNLYQMARNKPLVARDPSGLNPCDFLTKGCSSKFIGCGCLLVSLLDIATLKLPVVPWLSLLLNVADCGCDFASALAATCCCAENRKWEHAAGIGFTYIGVGISCLMDFLSFGDTLLNSPALTGPNIEKDILIMLGLMESSGLVVVEAGLSLCAGSGTGSCYSILKNLPRLPTWIAAGCP